jgi:protein TonB
MSVATALSGCAHAPAALPAAGGDLEARVLFGSCAKPIYPAQSLAAQDQGTVRMEFLVGADGRVVDSKVAQSSGYPALDETARNAIKLCKFEPAMKDGKPVQQWTHVAYVWTLK